METLLYFLHQPLLQAVFLLPIREAYEWKLGCKRQPTILYLFLLPIREAYEWKRLYRPIAMDSERSLLPIREAYEWKRLGGLTRRSVNGLASNS